MLPLDIECSYFLTFLKRIIPMIIHPIATVTPTPMMKEDIQIPVATPADTDPQLNKKYTED